MKKSQDNKSNSVTVIVVLYHSKHLMKNLLFNILDKVKNTNEIILVDNSDQDLSEFENDMIRILHPDKNLGYGGAINYGLKQAKNDLLLIINPDITINKYNIPYEININSKFILSAKPEEWDCMRAFPGLINDLLLFSFGYLGSFFSPIAKSYRKISIDNDLNIQNVDWVSGSFILTNKITMEYLKGFDENFFLFYEEVDLCKRAIMNNIPVQITRNISFKSNQGTSSVSDVSEIKHKSCIESAQRYHGLYNSPLFTRVLFLILKIYSWFIYRGLSVINYFLKKEKIKKKIRQYFIYFDSI